MDFELDDGQQGIVEAVDALLARRAGPARAIALAAKQGYDEALDEALAEAGFDGVVLGDESGPLEGALVVERIARAAGTVAAGATLLAVPAALRSLVPGPVALCRADEAGPVRFAPAARSLVVLDGDEARITALEPGDVIAVETPFGVPMGRIDAAARGRGEALAPGRAERLLAWWRVALAAEALGAMDAALRFTVGYLKERRQFGRPIGSFQAVQHRLAGCAVDVEGTRWLTYTAAAHGAPAEEAAVAAGHAVEAAGVVHRETHQLSGAIGYTLEHDLHVWSMRLQALRLELGGEGMHWRAAARARWGGR
jgi:alkylation response protein AidB-like acyl-CoA dehydrogenase